MQKRSLTLFFISVLMQACSAAPQPSKTPNADSLSTTAKIPRQSTHTATSETIPSLSVGANQVLPTGTPILSQDFWMDLPIVPITLTGRVREIYQQGLLMGNDPH